MAAARSHDAQGRRARLRLWVGRVHLWLGLTVGAFFALAGLTGAFLVFYVEADAAPHAELRPPPAAVSYESVFQALVAARPDLTGAWRIEVPAPGGAVSARYYKTAAAARRGFAPLVVWVDPAQRRAVRQAQWGETFATWMYDLHYALLIGAPGRIMMAVIGVLSLLLLVGGAWLWWPAPGKLRSALTVKGRASSQRRIYDLHKAAGVYGLAQLALLSATGVMLAAPAWFKPLLAAPAPLFEAPTPTSRCASGQPHIPVDRAVAAGLARFPAAKLKWIETPADAKGVFRINLRQPWEPSRRFPRTNVWVDACTGHVLAARDPRHDAPGDVVLNWLHPLHSGEVAGLAGRLLVLATGLGAPALFVTGLIRWRHKQQARQRVRARRGATALVGRLAPLSAELARAQRAAAGRLAKWRQETRHALAPPLTDDPPLGPLAAKPRQAASRDGLAPDR